MIIKNNFFFVFILIFLSSCVDQNISRKLPVKEKIYFSSKGFALIYEDQFFKNKTIKARLSNDKISVIHTTLKRNTPIRIINPENSKFIETKITKKAEYPGIFSAVITEKIANFLNLDIDNPYVEIFEIKKNKTFVAKESNTFEEESKVAEKAPVTEIKMDNLTEEKKLKKNDINKNKNFILIINDFYYLSSANDLKNDLIKKTNSDKFSVKKINDNKYRLLVGPFKNFNALKSTYISLNNLGFENLNIYKE